MDKISELKKEIVEISQSAFTNKLFAGTSGNLSAYLREENKMLITPTCVRYETMTEDDIVVMNLDGSGIEGRHQPSSEWRMHAVVYEEQNDVNVVFHTHSPYATAFAVVHKAVPVILIEMTPFLGGDIPCAPFASPGSRELGMSAVAEFKKGRNGCLLSNHGVLTKGADISQAYIRAEYVEDAAKIYHYALQAGTPVILTDN